MSYNRNSELTKWRYKKNKENILLVELGVDEKIIETIFEYDWEDFKRERRFKSRQILVLDSFLETFPTFVETDWCTIEEMMDCIENENLLNCLLKLNNRTLQIILLKTQGYSTKDISVLLDMTPSSIYSLMKRVKKTIKKGLKT